LLLIDSVIERDARFLSKFLSKFNKGAYVSGIKVFNHLPQYIKELINNQTF